MLLTLKNSSGLHTLDDLSLNDTTYFSSLILLRELLVDRRHILVCHSISLNQVSKHIHHMILFLPQLIKLQCKTTKVSDAISGRTCPSWFML